MRRIGRYLSVADLPIQSFCLWLLAAGLKNDPPGSSRSRNLLQPGHELSRRPEATRCGVNDDTLNFPFPLQLAKCSMSYRVPEGVNNEDIRDKLFSQDA